MVSTICFEELEKSKYPYLFTTKGYKRSGKYETITTIDVLKRFMDQGFEMVRLSSQDSKGIPMKYQKHLISMIHDDFESESDYQTQIILINSYDGTTKFQLHFGAWRYICNNGLMVGHAYFETPQIFHIGANTTKQVETVVEEMMARSVRLSELIRFLKKIRFTEEIRTEIAKEAVGIRWHKADPKKDSMPKYPAELLKTRRSEDDKIHKSAWGTLNILQENLIKGGFYVTSTNEDKKTLFLRAVKSLQLEIMIKLLVWNIVCEKARAPLL